MTTILIGACSWTDPGLIAAGTFYPPGATSAEARLRYYASEFPLVEVDSSYYALPSVRNSALWVERTPDTFTFDVKAFRLFTNHPTQLAALPKDIARELEPLAQGKRNLYYRDVPDALGEELWRRFREALEPLRAAGKLGVIVLQFPPWLTPSAAAEAHIRHCNEKLEGLEAAVEFRNAAWFRGDARTARTLALLEDLDLCFVAVDEPQGFASSVPPVAAVTGPVAVVRFHGRNAAMWEARTATASERFDHYYTEAELAEWVPRVQALASEAREVHLLMNTNNADQGVVNSRLLGQLLAQGQGRLFDT